MSSVKCSNSVALLGVRVKVGNFIKKNWLTIAVIGVASYVIKESSDTSELDTAKIKQLEGELDRLQSDQSYETRNQILKQIIKIYGSHLYTLRNINNADIRSLLNHLNRPTSFTSVAETRSKAGVLKARLQYMQYKQLLNHIGRSPRGIDEDGGLATTNAEEFNKYLNKVLNALQTMLPIETVLQGLLMPYIPRRTSRAGYAEQYAPIDTLDQVLKDWVDYAEANESNYELEFDSDLSKMMYDRRYPNQPFPESPDQNTLIGPANVFQAYINLYGSGEARRIFGY